MPTGIIVPSEAHYFLEMLGRGWVEIKYLFKIFILHLLLSSCVLAEKGSILCWKQRM